KKRAICCGAGPLGSGELTALCWRRGRAATPKRRKNTLSERCGRSADRRAPHRSSAVCLLRGGTLCQYPIKHHRAAHEQPHQRHHLAIPQGVLDQAAQIKGDSAGKYSQSHSVGKPSRVSAGQEKAPKVTEILHHKP